MRNLNLISNISRKKIMHFLDEEYGVNEVRLSKMSEYNRKAVLDFGAIYALLSGDSEITKKYRVADGFSIGFYEIVYISDFACSFMGVNNGQMYHVESEELIEYELNDVIYGLLVPSKEDTFIYRLEDGYILLNKQEKDEVLSIYDEYEVQDEFHILLDVAVHKNYLRYQMNMVMDLQVRYGDELLEKYEYYDIERAFDILYNVAMVAYRSEKEIDIYTIDYDYIFSYMCDSEMFIVEGEPEVFIFILIDVLTMEATMNKVATAALKSLKKSNENIFKYKKQISDKGVDQTPRELIELLDKNKEKLDGQIKNLLVFIDQVHALYHLEDIELTSTKQVFNSATIRNLSNMSNFLVLDKNKQVSQSNVPVADFLYHFLLALDFATIKDGEFVKESKYETLVRTGMDLLIGNILNNFFNVKVIATYLGTDESEAQKQINLYMKIIDDDCSGDYNKLNRKFLEILSMLSLISESKEGYKTAPLGLLCCEHISSKGKKGAKVLSMKDYMK